jgi:hypothetical protein
MEKWIALIQGKKTYIVAFVAAALGAWQALNPDTPVPEYVYLILASLGLGAVRSAIK